MIHQVELCRNKNRRDLEITLKDMERLKRSAVILDVFHGMSGCL